MKTFFLLLTTIMLSLSSMSFCSALKLNYYNTSCPQAEAIIRDITKSLLTISPSLAAPLLHMQFHDCFVRGCDGSILLNLTTNKNDQTEKMSPPNLSLRGYQVIDAAKEELERICPGTVSCADILPLVVRDAISLMYGPSWEVPTGRRDGRTSLSSEALSNLPAPSSNITNLKSAFLLKGLSVKDLVVLSGAHTIGMAHCQFFVKRLYNFTGKGDSDPAMDPAYVRELKQKCKLEDAAGASVEMDLNGSKTFDEAYYSLVWKNRGLFQSDDALLRDADTRAYVLNIHGGGGSFFKDFAESMVRLGKIGVLTGNAGEVRRRCYSVN